MQPICSLVLFLLSQSHSFFAQAVEPSTHFSLNNRNPVSILMTATFFKNLHIYGSVGHAVYTNLNA
uniref:Uncharacterized protein n=1 Tax=Rhizophora mucronata TaxID=61149 RepID=A0A2P2Q2R7_RHIMU